MNLGQLIQTLEEMAPGKRVVFDQGDVPERFASWRGSYDELTLVPSRDAKAPTVRALLSDAKAADGESFTGYKGGEFKMRQSTPVWADGWGEYRSRAITGARVEGATVILTTTDISEYR